MREARREVEQAMQVAFLTSRYDMRPAEAQQLLGLSSADMRAALKRLQAIKPQIERDGD